MALEADVRTFLSYLRVEKGLSDNTIKGYRRDMGKFVEFVRDLTKSNAVNITSIGTVVDFLADAL